MAAFPDSMALEEAAHHLRPERSQRGQHLYPVLDAEGRLTGVITRKDLRKLAQEHESKRTVGEFVRSSPIVSYVDEPLRAVVNRMASTGFTRLPVLDPEGRKLVGMVSLEDLLHARARSLSEERDRERVIRIRLPFGSQAASAETRSSAR